MAVRSIPVVAALGLVLGLLFLWRVPDPPQRNARVNGVAVVEHVPEDRPLAAVLILHSVFQSKATAAPVAAALARNGYLAVNVKLEEERDFEGFLAQLEPVFEHYAGEHEVMLWGHSMGADLACSLALAKPACRATVAVGFPVQSGPPNLLLAVGAWDQLHSRSVMEEAAAASEARLLVLPFSDHAMENFDPRVFAESVRWFDQALDLPPREPVVSVPDPFVVSGVCLFATFVLLVELLRRMRFRVLLVTLMMLLRQPVLTAAAALALVVVHGHGRLRPMAAVLPAGVAAYGLGLLLSGLPWLVERPGLLLGLPVCLAAAPFVYAMKLAEATVVAALVVPLVEFLLPGGFYQVGRTLQGARFRLKGRVSPVSVGVLVLCLIAAVLCWLRVLRAGYLPDPAQALAIAIVFLKALVVPVLAFVLMLKGIQTPRTERKLELDLD